MGLDKLGRYVIIRTLGKGAMGMVYEARDPNLDRRVAIKTIKVEHLSPQASAEYEARFRTEARSAARLQHPNIVSVYDSDRHGDVAYLVMEFVQGDDLKKILDSGKTYSLEQSLHLMRDLLSALEYAHRQNIVHRDVKPANMLVEANGRVKLTDFGVARIQDSGEATRTRGSMVGTLKYMAPEQVQGLTVDARADIFAAGVVLYQLLTGRRPFDGGSDFAIIQQIVGEPPAAPSTINALLPQAMDAVVAKALAKARDERYPSAQAFIMALQEAVGQVPDPTFVPPMGQRRGLDGAGTGSGSHRSYGRVGAGTYPSASDGSSSTVTQELELVYWKDVKDSDDPSDLQGFLERFPNGIYADLARRRVKRLAGHAGGDATATAMQTRVIDGSGSYSGFPATAALSEETLLMEGSSSGVGPALPRQPLVANAVPVVPLASPAAREDPVVPARNGIAAPATATQEPAMAAISAGPSGAGAATGTPVPAAPDTSPVGKKQQTTGKTLHENPSFHTPPKPMPETGLSIDSASTASGRSGKMLAAAFVMLLLVGLALWSFGPSPQPADAPAVAAVPGVTAQPVPGPAESAITSAPASAAAAPASGVATPVASTSAAVPTVKSVPAGAATVAASKGKTIAGSKAGDAPVPVPTPSGTGATPARAAADATPAAPAAPVAAKPANTKAVDAAPLAGSLLPGNPEKGCEGRVFLGFQTCMTAQCEKPEFFAHPICKQRRMAEQARAAQQNNRN